MELKKIHQTIKEIYHQPRFKFPRRRIEHRNDLHDLYELDSADLSSLANENNGYKYIIVLINTFSKYLYTAAVKNLKAQTVHNVVVQMLDKIGHPIINLYSDKGTEYKNRIFSLEMQKRGINHYFSESTKKCAHVERSIKTIKQWLYKEMAIEGTRNWVELLPSVTKTKNNTKHSRYGFKPIDVTTKNAGKIFKQFYSHPRPIINKPKFAVGESVRVLTKPATFKRAYDFYFSPQVYEIFAVNKKYPPVFRLKTHRGVPLKKSYYTEELVKVVYNDVFLVEDVLSKRGNKVKVRFWGYGSEDDAWVNKEDYIDFSKKNNENKK